MTSIVVLPNTEELDPHAVLGLINDLAEQLGCARVPYLRNGTGPALDMPALKELLDLALGLLDEEAEEDEPFIPTTLGPFDPNSYSYQQGQWSSASAGYYTRSYNSNNTSSTHSHGLNNTAPPVYTAPPGQASVGPGNTKLFKKIARYANWSDDLLKDVDPLIVGRFGRGKVLEWIENFITQVGYNPGNFSFTVGVASANTFTVAVYEAVTGRSLALTV